MLANYRLLIRVFLFIVTVFSSLIALTTPGPVEIGNSKVLPTHLEQSDGLAAWQQVYSVLISPRCINCHTATNYPQQGDDRHRHFANVVRGGAAGQGVPGLNCLSCHQTIMPTVPAFPVDQTGIWRPSQCDGRTSNDRPLSSAAVCRAVTDRSKNENMDGRALLKHHEEAALVLWAWNPGRRPDGTMRTLPPLTHAEFADATRRWVEAGTPCPKGR